MKLLLSERDEHRESENERRVKREKQRAANAAYLLETRAKIQAECTHLKGSKKIAPELGPTGKPDYAVWHHTFPDARVTVRCMLCSKEWSEQNGNLAEGLKLFSQSTNGATASEHRAEIRDREYPVGCDDKGDKWTS